MITKTTNLVATFNNSIGGKHVWTYRNIDTSVSDETIEECCDLLATLGIFEANGVKLFDSSVSAKYVHKTVTPVFDRKASGGAKPTCFPVENVEKASEEVEEMALPTVAQQEVSTQDLAEKTEVNHFSLIKNNPQIEEKSTIADKKLSASIPAVTLNSAQLPTLLSQKTESKTESKVSTNKVIPMQLPIEGIPVPQQSADSYKMPNNYSYQDFTKERVTELDRFLQAESLLQEKKTATEPAEPPEKQPGKKKQVGLIRRLLSRRNNPNKEGPKIRSHDPADRD